MNIRYVKAAVCRLKHRNKWELNLTEAELRNIAAYCYQNGAFTNDITLDEMIESNLKYLKEWNKETGEDFTADTARKELQAYLPTLERWKN